MDRVLLMDQSGAYAVHDALVELKGKGVRCLIVGLPVAQRDILEDVRVIPMSFRPRTCSTTSPA